MIRARLALALAARVLLALGAVLLAGAAYIVIDARVYQAGVLRQLAEPAPATRPATPLVDGDAMGRIAISRLGLTVAVIEGDSPRILRRAVGHLANTASPGEAGNVVLAGHRDTFFRPLRDVRVGDAITVTTRDGAFDYTVESTRVVPPTDLRVLDATSDHVLTLVTCFPFSYVGPAPYRFIVRAREARRADVLSGTDRPAPPGYAANR